MSGHWWSPQSLPIMQERQEYDAKAVVAALNQFYERYDNSSNELDIIDSAYELAERVKGYLYVRGLA